VNKNEVVRTPTGAPPYAPQLFEPGSEFVLTPMLIADDARLAYATKHTQLFHRMTSENRLVVSGERKLVTSNFRNLSKAFTDAGVKVKAWSFFSGELPGAEMIYQARQEPDDAFELALTLSLREIFLERVEMLKAEELWRSAEGGINNGWSDFEKVHEAGLDEVYLVDDWELLSEELKKRDDYEATGDGGNPGALRRPDDCLFESHGVGLNMIVANLPSNSYIWGFSNSSVVLQDFDGYQETRFVDRALYYDQPREAGAIGRSRIRARQNMKARIATGV